ncbi:hypothetical protein K466DRAFT_479472 [Polyporus arcularius HHB13444]|uniref:F-box domain-containing protein n=1 Tax=Polyporus arcularius HHB13444 TaxID=1314778 RepID=A0A5C3PTE4_9APHY|nr:hypothetical protein K466DRAFT_479472 [Polyporus arcularius HHB13444]
MPAGAAPSFLSLPAEVIERILTFSDPRDVSGYAQTCRYARKLVYEAEDQYLWRELYLGRPFDDLRRGIATPKGRIAAPSLSGTFDLSDPKEDAQWRPELQRRVRAELIASSGTRDADLLQAAYEAFLSAIDTAIPVPMDGAVRELQEEAAAGKEDRDSPSTPAALSRSENIRWVDRVLRKTRLLDVLPVYTGAIVNIPSLEQLNADGSVSPSEYDLEDARADPDGIDIPYPEVCWVPARFLQAQQMRARLRACVALSHESSFEIESRVRMAKLRKASRAFVYDMRKYQLSTLWGPYRTSEDGRTVLVNWEHVEHILNVVGLKLREIPISSLGYFKKPLFQMDALRAYTAVGAAQRAEDDWAGVSGTWRRFVCFMDYRDLYTYNYSTLPPGPHDPDFFDDPFDEALRPVELTLELITRDDYLAESHRIPFDPSTSSTRSASRGGPIGDCDHDPRFPTLYFKGYSRGAQHSDDATIRGKVSTLSDGAVRWHFVTSYDGRMQWGAEGVQVGHVCSAAGVAGIWTGAHHDRDDPAGPFWMVKVSDGLPNGVLNTLH